MRQKFHIPTVWSIKRTADRFDLKETESHSQPRDRRQTKARVYLSIASGLAADAFAALDRDARWLGGWATKDEDQYVSVPISEMTCGPHESALDRGVAFAKRVRESWKAGRAAKIELFRSAIVAALVAEFGWSTSRANRVAGECVWRRKAGCSCGCSPGFVDRSGEIRGDLWVTATFSLRNEK